jgi:hypothetical protein
MTNPSDEQIDELPTAFALRLTVDLNRNTGYRAGVSQRDSLASGDGNTPHLARQLVNRRAFPTPRQLYVAGPSNAER